MVLNNSSEKSVFRDRNLYVIFSISIMAVLGLTTISPAFPKMVEQLNIPPNKIGLLLAVFTLPGLIMTPLLGILSDKYGRKKILVTSLILYSLTGALCGFARSFDLLVFLRFLEGIGAASLGALNVALIGDLYSDKLRSRVMGYNTSVLSIGTAGFPLIGGFLTIFGWYYPFFLALLGLPVGLLTLMFLDEKREITNTNNRNYFREVYKYIRQKRNLVYFASNFFSYIILFGSFLTYTPFLVARIRNNDPLFIGILLSSMSVITALVSSQLGNLLKFTKEDTLLKISFILYAVALLIMPLIKNSYFLFIPTVIYGISQGLNVPSLLSLVSAAPPLELRGGFMSFNRMISQLGQTFGPLLMGSVFLILGLDSVFYFGAAIALITGSILIIFLKNKI